MTVVTLTATSGSPQTWTPPPDCPPGTVIDIECWGAASGGSGGTGSQGAGGAGGNWAHTFYPITSTDCTSGIAYTMQAGTAGTVAANSTVGPDTVFGVAPKNILPNTTNYGAVVGGALPDGWNLQATGGLAITVDALGVDAGTGFNYIDIKFLGTTTGTFFQVGLGNNSPGNAFPSAIAQYIWSGYLMLVAGGFTNVTDIAFQTNPSKVDGTFISTINAYFHSPPGITGSVVRYSGSAFTTPALTAQNDIFLLFTCSSGVAINFTLRMLGLQLEQAAAITTFLPTPTSYVLAKGGGATSGTTGGVSPHAANSFGTKVFKGGNGATRAQGGGGGGSAGKAGAGANSSTATGGTADAGSGGTANTSNVEGGGGGTGVATNGGTANAGGAPGGGGGGETGASGTNTGGAGGRGQIRITYTPSIWPLSVGPQLQPILAQ